MVANKDDTMGRFSVEVELANNEDVGLLRRGFLNPPQVRRARVSAVVDTGATRLVLPEQIVQQLGLETPSQVTVQYADGRRVSRPLATGVHLTFGDRNSVFNAVVEPGRKEALLGALVMEDLDLLPDCLHHTLVPRDPNQIISEVE